VPNTTMPDWLQTLLLLLSLGAIIYLTFKQARDAMKLSEEEQEIIYTEVKCGNSVSRREYREGDYVGKPVNDCEGGRIVGIYMVKPAKGSRRGTTPRL